MSGNHHLTPAEIAHDLAQLEEGIVHLRALHAIREAADVPGSPLAPPVACPSDFRLPHPLTTPDSPAPRSP